MIQKVETRSENNLFCRAYSSALSKAALHVKNSFINASSVIASFVLCSALVVAEVIVGVLVAASAPQAVSMRKVVFMFGDLFQVFLLRQITLFITRCCH